MDKDKTIKVLEMIAEDAKRDVNEFDGKPFNGLTVANFNGKQNAMIQALANILKEVIKNA